MLEIISSLFLIKSSSVIRSSSLRDLSSFSLSATDFWLDELASEVTKILDDKEIFFQKIGKTGGKKLIINDQEAVEIETLKKIHENWFNNYLEE